MKRTSNKNGPPTADAGNVTSPHPFELTFVGGYDSPDEVIEAELASPALDPRLHSDGAVRVRLGTESPGRKAKTPRFVLDSFHIASLVSYLALQEGLREQLEALLTRDQAEWDPDGKPVGKDLWKRAKLLSVDLRRLQLPDKELVAHYQKFPPPGGIPAQLSGTDTPDTRSLFTLIIECDWDDEHQLRLDFRNGVAGTPRHE